MVLEEQIQRYCFHLIKKKLFIFLIFLFLFFFIPFFFLYNTTIDKEKIIVIEKGRSIDEISLLFLNEEILFKKKINQKDNQNKGC